MNPVPMLVLVSLALVAFRFYQPWAARPTGVLVRRFRVPLMARVRLQRANVYAVALLMVLGGAGGWLSGGVQLLIAGTVIALLFIPIYYTLTNDGITIGRTSLRPWSAFTAVKRVGGRAFLTPVDGEMRFEVWLPAEPEGDAVEMTLKRLTGTLVSSATPPVAKVRGKAKRPATHGSHGVAKRVV